MDNPEIKKYEDRDVILTTKGLMAAAQKYGGSTDFKNPYLSPIYGDFRNFAQSPSSQGQMIIVTRL